MLKKLNALQKDFKAMPLNGFKVVTRPFVRQQKWKKITFLGVFVFISLVLTGYFYKKRIVTYEKENKIVALTPKQAKQKQFSENLENAFYDLKNGTGVKAENILAQYYQSKPDHERIVVNYAMSLKKQNKIKKATEVLQKFISHNGTKSSVAYNNLAILLQDQKQYDLAVNYFKQAYLLDNNNPKIILNLAILFEERQQWTISNNFYLSFLNHPMASIHLKDQVKKRIYKVQNLANFEQTKGLRYEYIQ